jgi:hypothetical protein
MHNIALLMAIGGVLAAGAGERPAASVAQTRVRMTFVPVEAPFVSSGELEAAGREAARLWKPYGVDLTVAPGQQACPSVPGPMLCVYVLFHKTVGEARAGGWEPSLGQVDFSPEGEPLPSIRIAYESIRTLLARWNRRYGLDSPKLLRYTIVGRALGRVLAHELGHFLTALPSHSERGLMRPTFRPQELADVSSRSFVLSPAETARLDIRLAALRDRMQLAEAAGQEKGYDPRGMGSEGQGARLRVRSNSRPIH